MEMLPMTAAEVRSTTPGPRGLAASVWPQFEQLPALFEATPPRRRAVSWAGEWPWRAVCALEIQGGRRRWAASGFLVGPRTVVTAAHVLVPAQGARAEGVVVHFGRSGDVSLLSAATSAWITAPGWATGFRASDDYAAIFLPEDAGRLLGVLPLSDGVALPRGTRLTVSGYPGGTGEAGPDQHVQVVPVSVTARRRLCYPALSSPADAGSPIWIAGPEEPRVVGIHTAGPCRLGPASGPGSSGVRIDTIVRRRIEHWAERDLL
jgi:V8-like Glu-specific endopeptidase